jgi:hypothetical protein
MKHIIQALNNIMKDVSYVQKSSKNEFHNYKYASEASLLESLRPAMIKHGLTLIPSVGNVSPIDQHGNTMLTVEYTLAHTSGEIWPDKIVAVGCGNDRSKSGSVGDKGVYKALTGANKYLLFKLFQIETGDDPEKDEAAPPPAEQKTESSQNQHKKPAAKSDAKSNLAPITYADNFTPAAEDVDKYVKVFVDALVFAKTEKEVREFWRQEAKNRALMAIQINNEEYTLMAEACTNRITTINEGAK